MPNQAPWEGFTAFSNENIQDLRRSLIVLNSYYSTMYHLKTITMNSNPKYTMFL